MPVEKITVSLPPELVGAIDGLCADEGVSRSSIVREATALYLGDRERARESARRRAAADGVLSLLDALRGRDPLDPRSVLEILREQRGPLDGEETP